MSDKRLVWLGSARRDLRSFPSDARRRGGFELRKVQQGLDPDDWKPMASVGPGVREIRIQTELAHRVFYLATFEEAVYVLHAFEKKTREDTSARRDARPGSVPGAAEETSRKCQEEVT